MTKENKKIFIGLGIIVSVFFISIHGVSAQSYTLVEPIPGVGTIIPGSENAFLVYLRAVFNFSIGAAALLAVLMIVIGGVQYTTSYGSSGKGEAKARILNAVLGLLLVLGAWVILYTINPDLVKLELNIPCLIDGPDCAGTTVSETPSVPPSTTTTYTYYPDEADVRANLEAVAIGVNNTQPCPVGMTYQNFYLLENTRCTSVGTLNAATIAALGNLRLDCGCEIEISGGTELGHRSHGPNIQIVDIIPPTENLKVYILREASGSPIFTSSGLLYTLRDGTKFLDETGGSQPHWHVVFN